MKNLFLSVLICVSLPSFASDGLICAIESATYYKRVLETQNLEVDKYKHCTISCIVGIECGVKPTAMIGVAKELYDLFGGGTPELEDLLANLRGLRLSQRGDIQNFEECSSHCQVYYSK
ncbi:MULTISPECIES: hypothetical protein [Halobacteriovorax]|uniref:Rap1a immunity protein domain-containing protein n=1 Tax=Halobacteriovorax vibrionivorans TaxID=2152716 RepID=A0ABY0IIG6_9BACT|nr:MULTISPECIES: hypothetical protein [Halobacteriovorax]AYF44136.1 hypothetical protein BALOs_1129 [Halobacteriovorax sp. BALOs_7]RZF21339.1 hypothetical protein DAY19_06540 [Halobacteriovorax vibrionivorans]TGD47903.1 hypothetical protein EP118_05590 [Halobacteriovorax sp. Y22]